MLWKSMCLVMKKIQPHLTPVDPSKNYLPKSHQQKRPNSAKMLKKLCLINEFVCKEIGKEFGKEIGKEYGKEFGI